MVVESTQEHQGTGNPATSVRPALTGEDSWPAGESSHKELMRLDDAAASPAPGGAAPLPPGETEPPPGKDAKAAGSNDVKSLGPDAKPSQPQAESKPQSTTGAATQPAAPKPAASSPKPVSAAKIKMQESLPALADDTDIGKEKEQTVSRDGKPDLGFTGTLLGSMASTAPKGMWQELRIYSTATGKHVFSRVTRTIFADDTDKHEADVFEPSPTSVSSQLMRSARDMTRSRPFTWMDAAISFFGYDPLAKGLYRKLSVDFEERI